MNELMPLIALTSAEHLGAAAVGALVCVGFVAATRRWPGPWRLPAGRALGAGLVLNLLVLPATLVLLSSALATRLHATTDDRLAVSAEARALAEPGGGPQL